MGETIQETGVLLLRAQQVGQFAIEDFHQTFYDLLIPVCCLPVDQAAQL